MEKSLYLLRTPKKKTFFVIVFKAHNEFLSRLWWKRKIITNLTTCLSYMSSLRLIQCSPENLEISVRQGAIPRITVVALRSCQAANGSFPRSPTLTSLFGAALDTNLSVELSTALSIAWFEERCQGQRDEWELVVDKARRWLVGLGQGGMVDQARWEGN